MLPIAVRWLLATWGYRAFVLMPALTAAGLVVGVGLTILGKWLFIGRYKEGEHPIWGSYYIRHWLANQFVVVSLLPIALLRLGTRTWLAEQQHACQDGRQPVLH